MSIEKTDSKIINFFRKISGVSARSALFVVFFWFGILKVLGFSPASIVVENLFYKTIPIMDFGNFIILFGLLECLIGILFLIKGAERVVIPILFIHMATTFMPLYFLEKEMWSGLFIPTMEGQYIIKNLLILALSISVASNLKPFKK